MSQRIVIVGGGTAGITVAARLLVADPHLQVTIIEPAEHHYYQPLWTLVGGGMFPREQSRRREADVIPRGATWVKDFVESFNPVANYVTTRGGKAIEYDCLVVAAGIQINWDRVKGLEQSLGTNGVCSNYSYHSVDATWNLINSLKSGTAVFTQPEGAVKCGGAPQKICYLAEDYFRRTGVRDQIEVIFALPANKIFAVDRYAATLDRLTARRGIDVRFQHNLVEVRGGSHEAVFRRIDDDQEVVVHYDLLHVTPPMGPPDFVAKSELADPGGWLEVDPASLQHIRYPNIFAIGDVANLPTSKTAAAIRKQAPVLVDNVFSFLKGGPLAAKYEGYTSCPIVTGYNSLILAEFDYNKIPQETFPFDQSEERCSMLLLKKYALPALYWHGMLKGRA